MKRTIEALAGLLFLACLTLGCVEYAHGHYEAGTMIAFVLGPLAACLPVALVMGISELARRP